jgi:hypothetical protein
VELLCQLRRNSVRLTNRSSRPRTAGFGQVIVGLGFLRHPSRALRGGLTPALGRKEQTTRALVAICGFVASPGVKTSGEFTSALGFAPGRHSVFGGTLSARVRSRWPLASLGQRSGFGRLASAGSLGFSGAPVLLGLGCSLLGVRGDLGQSLQRVVCVAELQTARRPNYAFKPTPLLGLRSSDR